MLALGKSLTKALAARTLAPQVCSSFATGPRQYDGTFYEFRTYCIKPSKMNEFLENVKKNIHLQTAHSELVGSWSVEFGGRIDKVFHIWKYDNFAQQTEVRKALANDKEWREQLLIPILGLTDKQESEITYLVPWCKLEKPPKEGVYELVTFQMKPGGPALWGDAFRRAINAHVDLGYSKLVGVFHTEYGALNRVSATLIFFSASAKYSVFMFFGGTRVRIAEQLGDTSLMRIPELWQLFGKVSIT
ncbi:protein NipSnap homolog 3A-like isoform X2 [Balaenoptera ricei]|uniref:Nipsnap homolog 3B n=1 Tax=Balaenoptera musculus TaxID=9771 RepID=A0A8C0CT65_BALMU|nr:protein NipSnap homolog 3A-like isoform X2 [Balaenoptera musculus]XP_059781194.1 protein NipSnap homolog 3A-like isoform X2 [Balaenoptera ricei]